jgi:phytoene dehydrogenase-like protein
MSARDRVVVVGGGHNGLAAAAWLARKGRAVVLCEARETLGGLGARERFGDGFAVPGILHAGPSRALVDALGLERHGLRVRTTPLRVCAPRAGADPIWIAGAGPDGLEGVSSEERERYAAWRSFVARVAPALERLMGTPPADPTGKLWPLLRMGLRLRRLGRADLTELARVAPMCTGDWLRTVLGDERLRAALALAGLEASFLGPWSAGSAALLLLREALAPLELEGGPAALTAALTAACTASGVELRTGAVVRRIVLGPGGASGVELEGGERIESTGVVASSDPRVALGELVGTQRLPARLSADLARIRSRGTSVKVHLALRGGPPACGGVEVEALRTGETLDDLERAFDAVKYGRASERPVLDVRVPSLADPALAPEGHHVVSILAHHAPFAPRAGPWDERARSGFLAATLGELERHCPGVADRVVASELLAPVDLADRYRLPGGHLHHGELAPDQLLFMRPTVDCARHRTPVPDLFLGSSGCHPGPYWRGTAGLFAAAALLAAR